MADTRITSGLSDEAQNSNDELSPPPSSGLAEFDVLRRGSGTNQRDQVDTRRHRHDGTNSDKIEISDLRGFLQTVDTAPTDAPRSFFDQIKVYRNGATLRLYVYDVANAAWRYTALT